MPIAPATEGPPRNQYAIASESPRSLDGSGYPRCLLAEGAQYRLLVARGVAFTY
jgi:hypothetical protein